MTACCDCSCCDEKPYEWLEKLHDLMEQNQVATWATFAALVVIAVVAIIILLNIGKEKI